MINTPFSLGLKTKSEKSREDADEIFNSFNISVNNFDYLQNVSGPYQAMYQVPTPGLSTSENMWTSFIINYMTEKKFSSEKSEEFREKNRQRAKEWREKNKIRVKNYQRMYRKKNKLKSEQDGSMIFMEEVLEELMDKDVEQVAVCKKITLSKTPEYRNAYQRDFRKFGPKKSRK
jgi:hypothetical protein